jgi:hypothetical protein
MYETAVARAAVDAGADVVIGHHAHITRGVEVWRGKPIFHGLGNFVTVTRALTVEGNPSPERRAWAERRKVLFGFEPLPDYPLYPFHPEARNGMVAACHIDETGAISPGFRPLWILPSGQPQPHGDDERGRAVADYIIDITRRKHDEEELVRYAKKLERSNAELESFASIASHDLQEPLRMVTSYVRLLEKRYNGHLDAQADKYIHYAGGARDRTVYGGRPGHRDRAAPLPTHLRDLPAAARARRVSGDGHRSGRLPEDRAAPRRADLGRVRGRTRHGVSLHVAEGRAMTLKTDVGVPIEILLVEDDPGDIELTLEGLAEARVRNHISVSMNGEDV